MADVTILDPPDGAAVSEQSLKASLGPLPAPFGTYRLAHWREAIRAFGTRLVPRTYPFLASIVSWPIWQLSVLGRSGPVDLEPFAGFRVRLYPRENHADAKCYGRAALCDPPEEAAIARSVRITSDNRFVMIDVGANTGTYSILAASLAKHTGKTPNIACIEANPKVQTRLAANLRFSGLEDVTRLIPSAVSDRDGTVLLDTATWNLGSVKVTKKTTPLKGERLVSVPARTLLSIVEDAGLNRVDFLKIDIEGHEVQALGPFLHSAPDHLMPRMIFAETKHDKGGQLRSLILHAGYKATLQGRSDTVFER